MKSVSHFFSSKKKSRPNGYLAQFYANDLLTIVQPPDEEQEQDRDLLRSRQKVMQQRNQLRKHLQAVFA